MACREFDSRTVLGWKQIKVDGSKYNLLGYSHMSNPIASKLVAHFGGRRETAQAFNCHPETVRLWLDRGIPLIRAIDAERLSKRAVTAEQIMAAAKKAA